MTVFKDRLPGTLKIRPTHSFGTTDRWRRVRGVALLILALILLAAIFSWASDRPSTPFPYTYVPPP
jgi:hypothetical protein